MNHRDTEALRVSVVTILDDFTMAAMSRFERSTIRGISRLYRLFQRNSGQTLQCPVHRINNDANGLQGSHAEKRFDIIGAEYHAPRCDFPHKRNLGEAEFILL